jgi:hypothetical protein
LVSFNRKAKEKGRSISFFNSVLPTPLAPENVGSGVVNGASSPISSYEIPSGSSSLIAASNCSRGTFGVELVVSACGVDAESLGLGVEGGLEGAEHPATNEIKQVTMPTKRISFTTFPFGNHK